VLIQLFDFDRLWFKSTIDCDFGALDFPYISCFLSSSIALAESPEFFIFNDALQDDKFSKFQFAERPQLRFIAGAALIGNLLAFNFVIVIFIIIFISQQKKLALGAYALLIRSLDIILL